ncbi:hypothetical protein CICLE_v10018103mg, partial [Citrus x clementina]
VEPADFVRKTGLSYPHTAHCLASGDILVSCLGDKDGNAEGNGFLLLDSEFNVKGSCLNWLDISITMSSSMSEVPNPHIKTCEKCCNDKILRTSRTRENPNRKFWKCKGCRAFEWDDDRKNSEYTVCRGVEDRNISEIIVKYVHK